MLKYSIGSKLHKRINGDDKLYGTTTIGARGQVVIPAEARKDLGLKPGDRLVVMGKFKKVLGLMKADQLRDFVEMMMEKLDGSGVEKEAREHLESIFGKNISKKTNIIK